MPHQQYYIFSTFLFRKIHFAECVQLWTSCVAPLLRTLTKMCSHQFDLLIKQCFLFHLLALNDLAVTHASCLYVFKEIIVPVILTSISIFTVFEEATNFSKEHQPSSKCFYVLVKWGRDKEEESRKNNSFFFLLCVIIAGNGWQLEALSKYSMTMWWDRN